jgi:hypothetical protein
MGIPRHPDQHDNPPDTNNITWRTRVLIAVIGTLFIAVIALHLTGIVGP